MLNRPRHVMNTHIDNKHFCYDWLFIVMYFVCHHNGTLWIAAMKQKVEKLLTSVHAIAWTVFTFTDKKTFPCFISHHKAIRYATLWNWVILFTPLPIVQSFIFSPFHWSWNYLFLRGVSFQVANTCLVFLPYLDFLCLLNAVVCEEFSNLPHSFFSPKWSIVIQYCEIKVIRVCNIFQVCRKRDWFITELTSIGWKALCVNGHWRRALHKRK